MMDKISMFFANHGVQDEQRKAVEMGIDLVQHNLYENYNKGNEFARYANYIRKDDNGKEVNYHEKNRLFHDALMTQCYRAIGETYGKTSISVRRALETETGFRNRMFSIVGLILDSLMSRTEVEAYLPFAEVQNVAWGDSAVFHVGTHGIYNVATLSKGKNRATLEKHYLSDITLTPQAHQASVQANFAEIVRGDVNWGNEITKIMKSFMTDISKTAADTMFAAYSSLATPFVENAYSQSKFTELAERIAAANNVDECTVYGTKSALGTVIPNNQYFGFQNGSEYMDLGYVQSPFGVPVVRLPQAVVPDSDFDFVLPNNKLVFLPAGVNDRPVKIAMEGETVVKVENEMDNAGRVRAYTVTMFYNIAIATGTIYGMMAVA